MRTLALFALAALTYGQTIPVVPESSTAARVPSAASVERYNALVKRSQQLAAEMEASATPEQKKLLAKAKQLQEEFAANEKRRLAIIPAEQKLKQAESEKLANEAKVVRQEMISSCGGMEIIVITPIDTGRGELRCGTVKAEVKP